MIFAYYGSYRSFDKTGKVPLQQRPNIVFVLFDSLGSHHTGLPDGTDDLPVLSRLCQSAAVFPNTYTPCPESSPARASLFTGLDPCVHGLWSNGVELGAHETTFVQRLASAGYANCLVGRWQLAGVSRWTTELTRPTEYSHVEWAHGPLHRSRQNAYLNWLQEHAPDHYNTLFEKQADPEFTLITEYQRSAISVLPEEYSFNSWVGQRVSTWLLAQPNSQPVLAVASFCVGDLMGTEPPLADDTEGLDKQSLKQADAAIGRLLDQLEADGRMRETVIVLCAARGNKSDAKSVMNEASIKVPLLIHRHGEKKSVEVLPVSTMDISSTILEIAGVPAGPRLQGQSLLGVIDGAARPKGWTLCRHRPEDSPSGRQWQSALCTSTMKLVMHHGDDKTGLQSRLALYNLQSDPGERDNLADSPDYEADLENMLDTMIDARCALEDRTEPRIADF